MYQIRFLNSSSGICSNPSGIVEVPVPRSDLMSDFASTTSEGPAMISFTTVPVFSTIRPLKVRSSRVTTSVFS